MNIGTPVSQKSDFGVTSNSSSSVRLLNMEGITTSVLNFSGIPSIKFILGRINGRMIRVLTQLTREMDS